MLKKFVVNKGIEKVGSLNWVFTNMSVHEAGHSVHHFRTLVDIKHGPLLNSLIGDVLLNTDMWVRSPAHIQVPFRLQFLICIFPCILPYRQVSLHLTIALSNFHSF